MEEQPKARVTRVGIGRLYNLGNYEHVRYDLTIEIPEGADALKAFTGLRRLVRALKPMKAKDHFFVRTEEIVAKVDAMSPEERTDAVGRGEFTEEAVTTYREKIAKRQARADQRKVALRLFNDLGGAEIHKDAKDGWDDEDDY